MESHGILSPWFCGNPVHHMITQVCIYLFMYFFVEQESGGPETRQHAGHWGVLRGHAFDPGETVREEAALSVAPLADPCPQGRGAPPCHDQGSTAGLQKVLLFLDGRKNRRGHW